MDTKENQAWENLQRAESSLKMIRAQIREIRPLKETDRRTWWLQYTRLRDLECIAEQEIRNCCRYLARHGSISQEELREYDELIEGNSDHAVRTDRDTGRAAGAGQRKA